MVSSTVVLGFVRTRVNFTNLPVTAERATLRVFAMLGCLHVPDHLLYEKQKPTRGNYSADETINSVCRILRLRQTIRKDCPAE